MLYFPLLTLSPTHTHAASYTPKQTHTKTRAGDLLPDTLMTFSSPQVLAALSSLTHLGLSELALAGPWSVEEWLRYVAVFSVVQFSKHNMFGSACLVHACCSCVLCCTLA